MKISSTIVGARDLDDLMSKMPNRMRDKAGHRSLAAGAMVIKQAAIQNVKSATADSKVATGTLVNGLRIYKLKKKRGMLRVGVMVKKGLVNKKKIIKGQPVRVGLYASVLDYGKANQPPTGWLRKAASNNTAEVVTKVESALKENINKIVEAAR